MITLDRKARIAAAMAALGVNFVLATGLASLAQHYGEQASRDLRAGGAGPVIATAQAGSLRCRPSRRASG